MPGSNSPRSRRLPSHGLRSGALARAVSARCPGWPAGTVAARVHRCAKTPARPPLAPLSRCESRPRAPLRILQVDVPTSTTTDHLNILIRGIRGRDDCHARFRKSPSFFGAAAARFHRGSGASTRPFHAAFACAWRPRALSSTSASVCCHEHDHGPLEPRAGDRSRGREAAFCFTSGFPRVSRSR
jgi:hypothetical protein